jgi:hypothetical protein
MGETYAALIVIGDNADTSDLEAQIRGSRQAWDVRVISLDALFKLASLKLSTDEPDSARLIRNVLVPREYTKIDPLVDIVSFIAGDVSSEINQEPSEGEEEDEKSYVSKLDTGGLRDEAKSILEKKLDQTLKDVSRTLMESEDGTIGVCYGQSRAYENPHYTGYWLGLRDHQVKFLEAHSKNYVAYDCVGAGLLFIKWDDLQRYLQSLGQSSVRGRHWYHIHLQYSEGKISLRLASPHGKVDFTGCLLPIRKNR